MAQEAMKAVPEALEAVLRKYPKAAVALSGGADSAYLLYAAKAAGCRVRAYCVQTAFQPAFEAKDAARLCLELGVELTVLPFDILGCPEVTGNPKDRCYYCKKRLFSLLCGQAAADGFPVVLDGTNASDDASDRPGMAALRELGVASPLREGDVGKAELRALSRAAGLFTWNKPAYACLATRVPAGEPITQDKLKRVDQAEAALGELGFSDLRVRLFAGAARIQIPGAQAVRAVELRREILERLSPLFEAVLLDLQERQKGD